MRYGYYTPEERWLRIVVVILVIIVLVLGIVIANQCSNHRDDSSGGIYPGVNDSEWEVEPYFPPIPKKEVRNTLRSLDSALSSPRTIVIQKEQRYEDCFLQQYPELKMAKDKNLGGAKLLGETCADAHGNCKSRSPNDDPYFQCPPLDDLGIGVDDSESGLPNRIDKGEVAADVSAIDNHGEWSLWYVIFGLNITIENLTGSEMDVVIRQGLLLETIGDDVQNIVVRKTVTAHLRAYEKQTVRVTAFCASHHRSSPVGYPARITPFYLMAESAVFNSQESVWQWQENRYALLRNSKTDSALIQGR